MESPETAKNIRTLETRVLWVRGFAVGWASFTLLTFALLAFIPGSLSDEFSEAEPIFISGSVLSLVFLIVLSWTMAGDVQSHLPRVLMVLRWQVTAGVVIAFSVGSFAREELRMGFYIYGTYLVIGAVFYMALGLIDLALSRHYKAADLTAQIEAATAMQIRNMSILQLLRRKQKSRRSQLRHPLNQRSISTHV